MSSIAEPRRPTADTRTYLPPEEPERDIAVDFAKFLRGFDVDGRPVRGAELHGPDGRVKHIPSELFEVLEQVADALAAGQGVTVAPSSTRMTTQQAADFLGVSRPTLVKHLDAGEIAHDKRGRHRRVLLRDLVEFQESFRVARRSALRDAARVGQRLEQSTPPKHQ